MATLDDRYESSGATLENPSTSSGAPSSRLDAGMDGRASSANVRASGVPRKSARSSRVPPVYRSNGKYYTVELRTFSGPDQRKADG